MTHRLLPTSLLLCLAAAAAAASPPTGGGDTWLVRRVGGDLEVETELKIDEYRCGAVVVTESLPRGYPPPTPPGAIELKRYPVVRRAEVSGEGESSWTRGRVFWTLFSHIKGREIAMTAPVEIRYRGWEASGEPEGWTMAFLYRTPDLGPAGVEGRVRVVDAGPRTVVAIGLRGPYGRAAAAPGVRRLHEWLSSQDDWEVAGDVRVLHYNGPDVADAAKWAEVQIPVRPAGDDVERPAADAPSAELDALDAVHHDPVEGAKG